MSDLDQRSQPADHHQRPLPEALRAIRALLMTPNDAPKYPRDPLDMVARQRGSRRLVRSQIRIDR